MHIISNFKDYYDFIVFETDNRKTYLRKMVFLSRYTHIYEKNETYKEYKNILNYISDFTFAFESVSYPYFIGCVAFCDEVFNYVLDKKENKFYYKYDEIPSNIIKSINTELKNANNFNTELIQIFDPSVKIKKYNWAAFIHNKYIRNPKLDARKAKLNTLCNCPVIFSSIKENIHPEIIINGRLQDIKFGQVKTPSEAYTDIYNFIPFIEPEPDSNPTDMNRYESKGFDKKTSFRNIK